MLDESCFVGLPLLFLNAKLMICQSGQVCDPFLLVWHAEQHPCLSQPCAEAHPLVPAMLPLLLHPPYYHTPYLITEFLCPLHMMLKSCNKSLVTPTVPF